MEGVVIAMLLLVALTCAIRKFKRANKLLRSKSVTIDDNTTPMNENECYATAETYELYAEID